MQSILVDRPTVGISTYWLLCSNNRSNANLGDRPECIIFSKTLITSIMQQDTDLTFSVF